MPRIKDAVKKKRYPKVVNKKFGKIGVSKMENVTGGVNFSKKRRTNIRRNYSGEEATRFAAKKPAIEESSKECHTSDRSLKKDKTNSFRKTLKTEGESAKDAVKGCLSDNLDNSFGGDVETKKSSNSVSDSTVDAKVSTTDKVVFVSLDFLEDCHKYKNKIRNVVGLKTSRKNSQKTKLKRDIRKSENRKVINGKTNCGKLQNYRNIFSLVKGNENSKVTKDEAGLLECKKSGVSSTRVNISASYLDVWPGYVDAKTSLNDVSKINEKYMKSLLMIVNPSEKISEVDRIDTVEKKVQKNGKISGREFFARKGKRNKLVKSANQQSRNTPTKTKRTDRSLENKASFTKLHVQTKSENQVEYDKRSKFGKYYAQNSEMKSEYKIADSKGNFSDGRKTRKLRNKKVRREVKDDIIEIPYPGEVSKRADVTEIWKRETRRGSNISLSSRSSTTVDEINDVYRFQNLGLESYKLLRKIVEDEVRRISTATKKQIKEKTQYTKLEDGAQDKICDLKKESNDNGEKYKKKSSDEEKLNDQTDNFTELSKEELEWIAKKKFLESKSPNYDRGGKLDGFGEFRKPEDVKKTFLGETNKKIPSEIIKNWSIMHRLQKAFLALGTPKFQSNSSKDSIIPRWNSSTKGDLSSICNKTKKKTPQENNRSQSKNDTDSDRKPGHNTTKAQKGGQMKKEDKRSEVSIPGTKPKSQGNAKKTEIENGQGRKTENDTKQFKRYKKKGTNLKKNSAGSIKVKSAVSYENNLKGKKLKPCTNKTPTKSGNKSSDHLPEAKIQQKTSKLKCSVCEKRLGETSSNVQNKVLDKRKSSKALPCTPDTKNNESLDRKKTFDVITKQYNVQTERSKSYCKIKQNFIKGENLEYRNSEKDTKDKSKNSPVKKPMRKSNLVKNVKNFKSCTQEKNNSESFCKVIKGKAILKTKPDEEIRQQIFPTEKEINTNCTERAVKERSILSMSVNQHGNQNSIKNFVPSQQQRPPKAEAIFKPTMKTQWESISGCNNATGSGISTRTYDLKDWNFHNSSSLRTDLRNKFKSHVMNITSSISNFSTETMDFLPTKEEKPGKCALWEQDMRHYRAIVEDIMSQYRRIGGMLKQNEYLENLGCNVKMSERPANVTDKPIGDTGQLNLREYRKRIISEYNALPIFDYKCKLQKEREMVKEDTNTKRNLLAVKALDKEMDLDVKDYKPNVQKILDSQLYVDTENIFKRNTNGVKVKEKKPSLQEMLLTNNEDRSVNEAVRERWQRTMSTPKTIPLACLNSSLPYSIPLEKTSHIISS